MRLFLAINLPPEVRGAAYKEASFLRAAVPAVGWVREPLLHMTLKFLGLRSPEDARNVAEAMHDVAARHRVIALRLGGICAFPNFRRPRVVWMAVSQEPRLELLRHDVELRCADLGFAVDGRPFRPHVTLGRVRERIGKDDRQRLARAGRLVAFESDVLVESIDLMQSELSPTGPQHTMVWSAPLGSD